MKHEASINVSSINWLTRLAGGLLLATGLFLISPAGFAADNPQDDAAFTCSSAVNVMDCIKQTGTGAPAPTQPLDVTALPINSGLLGFTGPVSVGIRYDNYLAWILDFGYVQSFLDNNAAAALKLSAGLNERRANVSLGYAITPKQQIKLTYEYLAQNLPFDFASGKVNEWVNQNALGASYRYIIGHNILKNIELYGTYTKASSKELTEKEMYINNLLTQINYRRIAGGTEMTAGGNVTLAPLKGTILKVGAGYSSLSFDTKWQDKEATAALVYNAELAHLLTPTTLVSTGIGNTASGRTHTAKVSQILPWSLEASLIGQYVATTNDIPGSTSVSASLSYPAPKTYENMITAGLSSIKDWVEKPVVYHSRVLAKAEERVVQVQITTKPIPPANIEVGTSLNPSIQTKNYFVFNPGVYDKISYQITAVTKKGDPSVTFPPDILNLQIAQVDNFNAVLSSAAPIQTVAMTPGQYTVTVEASGYRKDQVVSHINNSVDIAISGNPSLPAPSWKPGATVTPAVSGAPYPGTDLNKLVVDNSGLRDGDSYTFDLINYPTEWLALDGHSMVSNGNNVPVFADNPTTVTIDARSKVSGKPIEISPGNPGSKPFDIFINNTGTKPTWKQPAGSTLPDAPFGTAYIENNKNIDLNSYISSAGAAGALKFNCTTNCTPGQAANTQNLPVTPLVLDNNTGQILGAPNDIQQIGQSYNFSVVATNSVDLPSDEQKFTLTVKPNSSTITFTAAWSPTTTLPNAGNNQAYGGPNGINLSNYVNTSTTSGGTSLTDVISYQFTSNICTLSSPSWLAINVIGPGILSGAPAKGPENCTINVQASSRITGTSISLGNKVIAVSTGPRWDRSTFMHDAQAKYYDDNAFKETIDQRYVVSDYNANQQVDRISYDAGIPFPETWLQVTPGYPMEITSKTNDETLINKIKTQSECDADPGNFPLSATDLSGSTSQTFRACLLPNPDGLTELVWKNAPLNFTFGGPDININPYKNNNDQTYIIKTKKKGTNTDVEDNLTFSLDSSNNTCGSNITLNPDGIVSAKTANALGTPLCGFNFRIASKARGMSSGPFSATINLTGITPTWKSTQFTNSLKFTDVSNGIPLNGPNGYINSEGTGPGFSISLDSPNSTHWNIIDKSGIYYLVRKYINNNELDAGDISPSATAYDVSIILIAINGANNTSTPATLKMSVLPDPDIKFLMAGGTIQLPISSQTEANPGGSLIDRFSTCVEAACTHPIINDVIDMSKTLGATAVTLPSSTKITVTGVPDNTKSAQLSANPSLMKSQDAGIYNLNLSALTSKGAGPNHTTDPFAKQFEVLAYTNAPVWKDSLSSASVPFDDQGKTNLIDLNNQIVKGTEGANLRFEIDPGTANSGNWDIKTDTSGSHLIRQGVNAIDIGPAQVTIKAINDEANSSATFSVDVLPDPNIKLVWKKDYSIPVTIGKDPGNIPIDTNLIQSCIDVNCNTPVVGDQITKINTTQPLLTLPSGHTIQAIENNKSYFLTIPNFNTLPNSDAGTKALTFNGVTTKAQSTDTIVTGSITINNSVEPEWNKTALANGASIKFTSTATSAPDVINLNNFIAYPGTGNNFKIELDPNQPHWNIIPSGGTFYLVRNLMNNNQLDAGDIKAPVYVKLIASNNSESGTVQTLDQLKVNVTSDSGVQFRWNGGTMTAVLNTTSTHLIYNNASTTNPLIVCAVSDCSVTVSNDEITINGTASPLAFLNAGMNGTENILTANPTNLNSLGSYTNLFLPNLTSLAKGVPAQNTPPLVGLNFNVINTINNPTNYQFIYDFGGFYKRFTSIIFYPPTPLATGTTYKISNINVNFWSGAYFICANTEVKNWSNLNTCFDSGNNFTSGKNGTLVGETFTANGTVSIVFENMSSSPNSVYPVITSITFTK